jgi:hypothetical protein
MMASDGHGGKISGKLKDALPTIPDKIVDAIEAGKDVPIEALVSPGALDAHMEAEARRSEPVHMEDLTAVAKGDPRIAMNFDGESLPNAPATRRVIPAPFRRPRIELGHHGKSWQRLDACEVQPGDIVPDLGKITCSEAVTQYEPRHLFVPGGGDDRVAVRVDWVLTGLGGTAHFGRHEKLNVFTVEQQAE